MALSIEILDGPAQGQVFRIIVGLRLGRTVGEIKVPDAKISSLHAQVERNEKGQLLLIDKGSANGLRMGDAKVSRVLLMLGVNFRIGNTRFRVMESVTSETGVRGSISALGWKHTLREQVPLIILKNDSQQTQVHPFTPPIELHFLTGIQADDKVQLGYGPRLAGSDVLDIELQEENAPDIAFELVPVSEGVLFKTSYPTLVQLNGQAVSSEVLKAGDQIQIGSSLIEVNFLA